jgi:hypothetical protein
MIITPEAVQHSPAQMISFYKKHFRVVNALTCLKCKNTLALELSEPHTNDLMGLSPNSLGIIVLPVDEKLLSHRVRLDGMIGYQCICGNDTRSFDIEEELSPLGDFHPHEVHAIKARMQDVGWKAPVKTINDSKEQRGSFTAERV